MLTRLISRDPYPPFLRVYLVGIVHLFSVGFSAVTGQALVQLTVESGAATTTCGDVFSSPDPQWGVEVNGTGWVTYPASGGCYQEVPFQQYQATYTCPGDLPATLQVCFRAFEDDGFFCNPITSCNEEVCNDFPIPLPGETVAYSLALPGGGSSAGSVQFTLATLGALSVNDAICDAIDLGVLPPGGTLGDVLVSAYSNTCATNLNEPSPSSEGGSWSNDNGVWFTFTTSAMPGAVIPILASSDPQGLGDPLHTQIAVYESSDGTCAGTLALVDESFTTAAFNTKLVMGCLKPATTYFVLIDGTGLFDPAGETGYFGLAIFDGQSIAGGDTRCEAEDLGVIPEGGSVSVGNNTNVCATSAGDPTVVAGLFGVSRGVWYQFTPPESGNVVVEVTSGEPIPAGFGAIDLELALYHTANNLCNGFRILDTATYQNNGFNESFEIFCLDPEIPYWLLVDGSAIDDAGVFDILISDGGNPPPFISIDTTVCFGQSVSIGGLVYSQTGNYAQAFPLDNGCDSTVFLNLTVQALLEATGMEVSPSTSLVNPNGIATVQISGGGKPYSIIWSNGQTGDTLTGLPAGVYCALVTDTLGCTDTACIEIILELEPIDAVLQGDSLDCSGDQDGELWLTASGGDAPYTVLWTGASTGTTGMDELSVEGNNLVIENLEADIYAVTLTDLNGTTTVINGEVYEPEPLTAQLTEQINPSCYSFCDGSLEVAIEGGTKPYSFLWSDGQQAQTAVSLCAGTYEVTITDKNGCMITLNSILTDPAEFIAEATPLSPITCFGDSDGVANVNTNGTPVSFLWDNGEVEPTAQNLTAGIHTVVVENADGCTDTTQVLIEGPSTALFAEIVETNPVTCPGDADGAIVLQPQGGASGYEIVWESGEVTPGLAAISAGQYSATLTDAYGCTLESMYILEDPAPIEVILDIRDATCAGEKQDGSIRVEEVTGGEAPYQYRLLTPVFADSEIFVGLQPDQYMVDIRDSRGCIASFEGIVLPPEEVLLQMPEKITIQAGEAVQIDIFAFPEDNLHYAWTPADSLSCTDCPEPIASPLTNSRYVLQVLDTVSLCRAVGIVPVEVIWNRDVYIPNIFSPDGDGQNDRFLIFGGSQVKTIHNLAIFSRWGEKVFEGRQLTPGNWDQGWDGTWRGKQVEPGVYVYVATIEFIDGRVEEYGGDVSKIK